MAMRWMLICLLMLGSMGVARAQLATRSFRYDLALDIDTQGRVARVTLPDGVPAPFVSPLQQAASRWSFKAPIRDGAAVTARTYARVKLVLVPKDAQHYGMQIDFLSNGPSLTLTRYPDYPPEMIRDRAEGTVIMSAVVQPDGRVTDIRLVSAKLSQHEVVRTQHATRVFADAARESMRSMRAEPEWIDGKPVATAIVWPVSFGLNGTNGDGASASGSAVGR
jgi:TonB family protein